MKITTKADPQRQRNEFFDNIIINDNNNPSQFVYNRYKRKNIRTTDCRYKQRFRRYTKNIITSLFLKIIITTSKDFFVILLYIILLVYYQYLIFHIQT